MRTAVTNDKAMLSFIIRAFMDLSTDNAGQMVNAKCVDQVMYDILGQRKFVVRLCKSVKNEMELFSLFNGVSIPDFYGILSDEGQFMALKQTCMLQREIQGLKIKIKKKIKKGNKPKKDREYLTKLEKIYKKSIKTFKNLLGIRDIKKDAKPKDKYAAIVKFNKRYADDDIYSFLIDDDYDDYDDSSAGFFTADESALLGGRMPIYRNNMTHQIIDLEDDDDDDYDDDLEDLRQEMSNRFDGMEDKFQKLLSGMGKIISIHEGSASLPKDNDPSVEEMKINTYICNEDYDDDPEEDDLRNTVYELTKTVNKIVEFVQEFFPETADERANERPVPLPEDNQNDVADVNLAMAAMFADDEESQPLKVNGEVVQPINPETLTTPEVIDVRNEEVAKNASVNEMVEATIDGKRS